MENNTVKLTKLTNKFEQEIRALLGGLSSTPSGFEKRNCMLCHLKGHGADHRGRFGILFGNDAISVHCFNCGYKAYWRHGDQFSKAFNDFLGEIGFDSSRLSRWQFAFFSVTQRIGLDAGTNPLYDESKKVFPYDIIDRWQKMDNDLVFLNELSYLKKTSKIKKVLQYVNQRDLNCYKDKLAYSESLPDRLIIPFTHNGDVIGYTGRSIKGRSLKYLDRYSNRDTSSTYLYNYYSNLISNNEYVIITDGVIDAMHTMGIATMRSDLNDIQQKLINHLKLKKKIILVPDFDNAGFDYIKYAKFNGWYVSAPHWKDGLKDVDEMVGKYGRLLTVYSIIKNANKDYITLKTKARFSQVNHTGRRIK